MKKEVSRERKLPPFSLSIGELEALWSHLTELFDDQADIRARIEIRLPSEQLEFAKLEELKQPCGTVKPSITNGCRGF